MRHALALLLALLVAVPAAAAIRLRATRSGSIFHHYYNGAQTYGQLGSDMRYGYLYYQTYPYWTREWWNAWMVFDLSALPDSCEPLSAALAFYQNSTSGSGQRLQLARLPDWDLEPRTMFSILDTAARLAGLYQNVPGENLMPLDSAGIAAIRQALASDSLVLAITHNNLGYSQAQGWTEARPPELVVGLEREADLHACLAELARPPCAASDTEPVNLTFTNIGNTPSAGGIVYTIVASARVDSLPFPALGPGDTAHLRVSLPVPADWRGTHEFAFIVYDPLDYNIANDTARLPTWVYPPRTCHVDSFEPHEPFPPAGWIEVSNDTGHYHWYRSIRRGDERSGIGAARCRWEQGFPNDDWLITMPLQPEAGNPDTAGFFIRSTLTPDNYIVEAWTLSGPGPGDSVALLGQLTCTDQYVEHRFGLDDFDGSTVRFAIRNRSTGNSIILVDDFYCSCPNTGAVAEEPAQPLPRLAIRPNPARGLAQVTLPETVSGVLTILDISGREAWTTRPAPARTGTIQLPLLPAGVYLVRLRDSSSD
ncbi:T9SS type A sorting domain-containing protein, partial [candidate division WOR-3 bacterium]|nr:T9SS type A sorting domain-containing protein [candidate division WOR-3 bacterium]